MPPPPLPTRATPPPVPSRPNNNPTLYSDRDAHVARGKTFNTWVRVESTNVKEVMVEPDYDLNGELTGTGEIWIRFLSGALYSYPDRKMSDWFDIIESSSKGSFTYYEVRGAGKSRKGMGLWKPCIQHNGPTVDAQTLAALRAANAPRTAAHRARKYTRGGRRNKVQRGVSIG